MFWRFGGYSAVSPIHTILDRPSHSLEDILDEQELPSDLKNHDSRLIEYLRDDKILKRLITLITAPRPHYAADDEDWLDDDEETASPPQGTAVDGDGAEEIEKDRPRPSRQERAEHARQRTDAEAARRKHADTASDVLSAEVWSIIEAVMDDESHLLQLWSYLDSSAPLEPQTASSFVKVNENLADKKTEAMVSFLQAHDTSVGKLLKHVECPVIMDLCMKLLSLSNAEGGEGILDWLYDQEFIPTLLACFDSHHSQSLQTAAGDFLKGVITLSANAAQTQEQCIGPNELTRQLVSEQYISRLIKSMSVGGNSLTVGVGIVIEVIRKNNSDYDPEGVTSSSHPPTSRDPIYLGTVLRLFAQHIPEFMDLLRTSERIVTGPDGNQKKAARQPRLVAGQWVEPLGFDRFKTCELMAELLHCSNMSLLNEKGSEAFIQARDEERTRLKAAGKLLRRYTPPGPTDEFGDFQSAETGDSNAGEDFAHGDDDDFEQVGASGDLKDMSASKEFEEVGREEIEDVPLKSPFEDDGEFVEESSSPEHLAADIKKTLHEEATPEELKEFDRLKVDEVEERKDRRTSATERHIAEAAAAASGFDVTSGASSGPEGHSPLHRRTGSIDKVLEEQRPKPRLLSHTSPNVSPHNSISAASAVEPDLPHDSDAGHRASSMSSTDTTHGIDGESLHSQDSGPEVYEYTIETEEDGSSLVGDYLKMMFVDHHVVPTILDFFFAFPWNNFLHNVVYDVVQQVFNGPMARGFNRQLAISLFTQGNITERIVEGNRRNEDAEKNGNRRIGYMGHLTLIAEEIVKFTERNSAEVLTQAVVDKVTDVGWVEYVEFTLVQTRERDNAILGGERPDSSISARQTALAQGFALNAGASTVLANAGIGTGAASLGSPGADSNGTHFVENLGGPSDEYEQEADDVDATSANTWTTHLNDSEMAEGSKAPDSGQMAVIPPPPPPPLNVPTRARRQLAVRLAQRQKELEDANANGGIGDAGIGSHSTALGEGMRGFGQSGDGSSVGGAFVVEPGRELHSGLDSSSESSAESDDHDNEAIDDDYDENDAAGHRRRPSYTTTPRHRSSIEDSSSEEGQEEHDDDDDDEDEDAESSDEETESFRTRHLKQRTVSMKGGPGSPADSSSAETSEEGEDDDEDEAEAKPSAQKEDVAAAFAADLTPPQHARSSKSKSAQSTPTHSRSSSGAQHAVKSLETMKA